MTAPSATDVTRVKFERMFDALDANNDGHLDWSDYQNLVDRHVSVFQLAKNDPRAGGIQAYYQMYWQELLRHANPETPRLTKEQYVEAHRLATLDNSRFHLVEGCAHATFDCMDVNGDNEVSKEEFQNFQKQVWNISQPDAIETFHRLDLDGDGSISRQELVRAVHEFYYSNDLNNAGGAFFGVA